jgi:hypothetical protein
VGVTEDVLKQTKYGEIIKRDPDDLSAKLQYLILNWEKYEKDPKNITKIIEKQYNWPHLAKTLHNEINK